VSHAPPILSAPSPNHDARTGPISLVVLHYTGMATLDAALSRLTDAAPIAGRYLGPWQDPATPGETPLGRVSAHYVIGRDGTVFQLVPEERRAWHAGVSHWAGMDGVNDHSIGIEIDNGGHDFGLPPFADAQIDAVIALVRGICERHGLGPHQVVGHCDVAPGRKLDPGERFPWRSLAQAGVALWPLSSLSSSSDGVRVIARDGDAGMAVLALQETLAAIGYGVAQSGQFDATTRAVVEAFQRRFRPGRIDGVFDDQCAAIAADIASQTARLTIARLRS
jgi:N-acetylmuramoyl-L-alanine amidase